MRLISIYLAVLAAASLCQDTNADDAPKRSAELQILDRFVGTWDFVAETTPTGAETTTLKTVETRSWSPGEGFVHFHNPNKENPALAEFHLLLTYDPVKKTYPGVMMVGSIRYTITATWDQKITTMTFRGSSDDDGNSLVYKNHFIDKDHAETTGVITNAGKVVMEQTVKQTRRRE